MDTITQMLAPYVTGGNAAILVGTWALIEATSPMVDAAVMSQRLLPYRVGIYTWAKRGKRIAAVLWCSALVWVPTFQPPLCAGTMVPLDCQTLLDRLATGAVLGIVLSLGHATAVAALRRLTGRRKRVLVTCANCGAESKVVSFSDSCPACGQPPHEVTHL